MELTSLCYHKKLAGNVAAGTDANAVDLTAIDVRALGNFNRARVIVELGTVVDLATIEVAVQECATSDGEYTVIAALDEDPVVVTGKSENCIIIDVPIKEKYLQVEYKRTTKNIEFDGIYIDLYDNRQIPVVQNTSVFMEVLV